VILCVRNVKVEGSFWLFVTALIMFLALLFPFYEYEYDEYESESYCPLHRVDPINLIVGNEMSLRGHVSLMRLCKSWYLGVQRMTLVLRLDPTSVG